MPMRVAATVRRIRSTARIEGAQLWRLFVNARIIATLGCSPKIAILVLADLETGTTTLAGHRSIASARLHPQHWRLLGTGHSPPFAAIVVSPAQDNGLIGEAPYG